MNRLLPFTSLAALALLAGCASKPAPAPAPAPVVIRPVVRTPVLVPPPPANADWSLWPLTPGGWVYSQDASGSQASFGRAEGEPSFILRCERDRRQILLSREGRGSELTVRASSTAQTLPAGPRTEPRPYLSAALPVSDALLDAMVFSRGRFTVEAQGAPMLVIPSWPEPARVVEDCRA